MDQIDRAIIGLIIIGLVGLLLLNLKSITSLSDEVHNYHDEVQMLGSYIQEKIDNK